MKKRKRIFLTMLTTILTFLGVLLGINNAPKVEAATSPYLNIRYETYLLEDYVKMEKWSGWDADVSKMSTYEGMGMADTFWSMQAVCPSAKDPSKSIKDYYVDLINEETSGGITVSTWAELKAYLTAFSITSHVLENPLSVPT